MRVAISTPDDRWEDMEALARQFPSWFISGFRPETTPDEDTRWLAHWRKASPTERRRLEDERGWSFAEWCYWMEPSQRKWQWWRADTTANEDLVLEIAVEEWPFADGALRSMLRLSGFTKVEEDARNER
jgi:hypothetical protein